MYCIENPETKRNDLITDEKCLKFNDDKTYLEINPLLKNKPNFYGFMDFETISPDTGDFDNIRVCSKHRLAGEIECKCSQTISTSKIESLSYSLIVLDYVTKKVIFDVFYIKKNESDLNVGEHLVKTLQKLAHVIEFLNNKNIEIKLTEEEKVKHALATNCNLCRRKFSDFELDKCQTVDDIFNHKLLDSCKTFINQTFVQKVRHHHHHVEGNNFESSLCSRCNLGIQSNRQMVPIFCHNFGKFDHTFLLKDLCKFWKAKNAFGREKIMVKVLTKTLNDFIAIIAPPFVFKDSLNFLSGSLDANVELVKKSCERRCKGCEDESEKCDKCQKESEFLLKRSFDMVVHSQLSQLKGEFSNTRFLSNIKKSAFPYSILTSYTDLYKMTDFPEYHSFYSILKGKNVDVEDYLSAKNYFQKYCRNMYEFLEVYNKLDVYLLCCVWKIMSEILNEQFGFFLENFYSL